MTEKEYRDVDRMSYSRLKVFMDDRIKYMRTFEQGQWRPSKHTVATRFGNLTDTLLLEPETFDERFVVATCDKPKGQLGEFIDTLYDLTLDCTDEEGTVTLDMDVLLQDAYNLVAFDDEGERVKFKRKNFTQVVSDFISKGEGYYTEMRENTERVLITMEEERKAKELVKILRTHRVTRDVVNLETDDEREVRNQEIVLYDCHGHPCKSMIDKLVINHRKKIIQPFDLKTTTFIEQFVNNYLRYRYYVQAAMYDVAVKHIAVVQEDWYDYTILPMKFIAADSNCYYDPIIYTLDQEDLNNAFIGFNMDGKEYMGVSGALEDIHWHRETNIWTVSKANYDNTGIVPLKLRYR